MLLDTPGDTCLTGFDFIVQSPRVGSIDVCDQLAEMVAFLAAPPQPMMLNWESFCASAQRSGLDTPLEGFVTQPDVMWKVPQGAPPARSRLVWLALDAVSHHLILEWRVGRGWRLLQSYLKFNSSGADYSHGYTALEWASASHPCGSADPSSHRRFGQGKWLSDCLLPKTTFGIGARAGVPPAALLVYLQRVSAVSE